jgi:hypothetical protein
MDTINHSKQQDGKNNPLNGKRLTKSGGYLALSSLCTTNFPFS